MIEHNRTHAGELALRQRDGWTADLDAGVIVFKFAGDRTATRHFKASVSMMKSPGNSLGLGHKVTQNNKYMHAKLAIGDAFTATAFSFQPPSAAP